MKFLQEPESWMILCKKVFDNEDCPLELEEVGKNIAKACKGLPLAIHVAGGILSQTERTQESWLQLAKDIRSTVITNDELFYNILSLSYNYLPLHLRPCFLYMAAFLEDCPIETSKLIKV